jgi:Domain of unknown function (DUF5668)
MHVRRGYLFAGLFLIPVGAITLLVRAGTIDANALADAWKLWPLILVGFGIALLLGRSRVASIGTAVAALVLGVLVGSAVASGNVWIGDLAACGASSSNALQVEKSGTFDGLSTVDLRLRCGSVAFRTQPGTDWSVAAMYEGVAPIVTDTANRLEVRVPDGSGVRHNDWTIAAGWEALHELRVETNAATGSLTLDGATPSSGIDVVDVDSNAGDILIDGSQVTIGRIGVSMNAGRARVSLHAATGELSVNAGAIDLCVPPDANLRFIVNDQLTFVTNLADRGLQQTGTVWTRSGSSDVPDIDLTLTGNAATLTLDPDGGCR